MQRIPFQVVDIMVFLYDIGTHVVDFQICTVERDCQFISWIGPLVGAGVQSLLVPRCIEEEAYGICWRQRG